MRGPIPPRPSKINEVILAPKYYSSCEDLPLNLYIRCQVDNDLTALVIEGNPEEAELLDAWGKITEEYYERADEALDTHSVGLYMEVQSLTIKIEVIQESISVLKKYYCPELIDILKGHGFEIKGDETSEEYISRLEKVSKRSKSLLLTLQDKFSQLERLKKSKKEGDKITRKYYGKLLAYLSKFVEYRIDKNVTTVNEFADILNMYIVSSEQIKEMENGRG